MQGTPQVVDLVNAVVIEKQLACNERDPDLL